MASFLADKGQSVLRNGFNVIPIRPGEKAPSVSGWEKVQTTEAQLNNWLSNGRANHGLGIPTKYTPFVDIDTFDRGCLRHLIDLIVIHIGFAPCRVGNAPKRGFLFKTANPFPYIGSKRYRDPEGRKAQVEILCDGRQFVAFHIHPDTHKPYRWLRGESPETETADSLLELTQERGRWIVERFEEYCEGQGWQRWHDNLPAPVERPGFMDDEFGIGTDACGLTDEEITAKLMAIPNDDRFDAREDWLKIGFAVHHESGGSEHGRESWLEWSEQHPSHDDALFEKAWNSFGKRGEEFRGITFRFVLKLAKGYEQAAVAEQVNELMRRMDFAKDLPELKDIAADCRKLEVDLMDRARLIAAFQKSVKATTNTVLGVREAREMIRYRPGVGETPEWLDGWCYLKHAKRFYHRKTGEMIEHEAFNAACGRYVGSEVIASKYALDTVKIPVYHMTIYLPDAEEVVTDSSGLEWINTYRDTAPAVPTELTRRDLRNVEIVENHFYHLFEDEREIQILLSTLAYIVQTKKRPNWMTILQGAEAIGKTFILDMMAVVLGGTPHVYKLDTEVLTGSPFTDWSGGHQFIFIEEIKVYGHRFDVLNKLKTRITDSPVTVHSKGISPYNVPNTTTYMAATNHKDSVPLDESDTRYFVLMSRWQTKEAVAHFKAENPDYYTRLFSAIEESPGAIRGWLLGYKLHPDFNPVNRAPHSHGRDLIVEQQKPELQYQIEDLIAEKVSPLVSNDLIVFHILAELLSDDGVVPQTKDIISILKSMEFSGVRERRLKMAYPERKDFYCWSRTPRIISATKDELRQKIEDLIMGASEL